jgi:hypothetical protein
VSRWLGRLGPAAVLLAVGFGFSLPLRHAYERGRVFAPGSSQRSDGEGTRALFLLLQETGARPRRVRRAAPEEPRGVLLSVTPQAAEHDPLLLDWVREGNVLLLADALPAPRPGPEPRRSPVPAPGASPPPPLRETLGIPEPPPPLVRALGLRLEHGATPAPLADASLLAADLAAWPGDEARHYWAERPRDARVLLGGEERPVLIGFALGRGRVLALSDAAWLSNAGLSQGARLELVLSLLRRSRLPVLFDEYRHGIAERPGLAYVLARYRLLPTAFAALALLGLLAWRTSPAEAPHPAESREREPVRDSLLEARSGLLARTLGASEALSLLDHDLRAALGERLGRRARSWRDLRQRLGERHPELVPGLDALRRELQALRARPARGLDGLVAPARRGAELVVAVAPPRAAPRRP